MSSREEILARVKGNQPDQRELPVLPGEVGSNGVTAGDANRSSDPADAFISVLEAIGGTAFVVSGYDRVATILHEQYAKQGRIISGIPGLAAFAETGQRYADPHVLENVELAVLAAHFGVAENGACWITEDRMVERALPFIAQHLALVIKKSDIVANMHQAYERIAAMESSGGSYGFATFIAGPSKTADIEQSLVLGAHGPRSMIVFLIDEGLSDAGYF